MVDHEGYHFQSQNSDLKIEDDVMYIDDVEGEFDPDHAADELLISLVQGYPHLYNKELTDFKDVCKKESSWREIARTAEMDAKACQKRWTRLRERYSREKSIRERETVTGSGTSRRKPFIFYENMSFLHRFVHRRKPVTNMKSHRKITQPRSTPRGSGNSRTATWVNWHGPLVGHSVPDPLGISPSEASLLAPGERSGMSSKMQMQGSTPSRTTPKPLAASHSQKPDGNSDSETPHDRPCSSASFTSTTTSSLEEQVPQAFADAECVMNRSITNRRQGKVPSKADPVHTAILEIADFMKNKFASETSTSCVSSRVSADMAFCQFILSSMAEMSEGRKKDFKRKVLQSLVQ